jgi:hypothetical protein
MKLQALLKKLLERGVSVATYIFPFLQVTVYFAARVCYSSNDIGFKVTYANFLHPLILFYNQNVYMISIAMVGIFLLCSRNSLPMTKFLRFNVLQAILLDIICSCVGQIYMACSVTFKLSTFGVMFANFVYVGTLSWIAYSIVIISLGRFPVLPFISRAANIHLQR